MDDHRRVFAGGGWPCGSVTPGFLRLKGCDVAARAGIIFWRANTLAWPVIRLAMFAANISTVHLVSLAEAAYKYGLVFGNFRVDGRLHPDSCSRSFSRRFISVRAWRTHCRIFLGTAFQSRLAAMCCRSCLLVFRHRDSHGRGALHGGVGIARDSRPPRRARRFWAWMR